MQKKKVWTSWEMWRMQETSCRVWTSETCLLWKKEKGMTNEDSGFWKFSKKYLQNNQDYANIQEQKKRWKRLLSSDVDRNTASPTESAVWKRRQREHSGADWLNRILQEKEWELAKYRVGQYVWYALNIKSGKVVIAMIFQCGCYRGNIEEWDPAPEQWNVPGRFLFLIFIISKFIKMNQ